MDKPKLTLREIIFEGIKKFAGEIIGVVLLACFLWFFPSLKSLFTEHTFTEKNESQSEIQRELEAHRKEEERLKEELKRREEALKAAEEAKQKAEAPKAQAEKTEPVSSMQTVKADAIGVVKAQQDKNAQEAATQEKQKTGAELLRAVLEKYGPEDFFSASLNPKIFYDEKTNKPYIQVTEKFNQSVFWDKFLPELRKALDGVAVKKTKQFYEDMVRKVNQTLNKQGYYNGWSAEPYASSGIEIESYSVVVPDNAASFTAYKMPFGTLAGSSWSMVIGNIIAADDNTLKGKFKEFDDSYERRELDIKPEQRDIGMALLHFVQKMCRPFAYSITYMDKDGDVISVQVVKKNLGAFMFYRSLYSTNEYRNILSSWKLSFAPGYLFHSEREGRDIAALSTEEGYTVELDSDELRRLDSMKFEVIFE